MYTVNKNMSINQCVVSLNLDNSQQDNSPGAARYSEGSLFEGSLFRTHKFCIPGGLLIRK